MPEINMVDYINRVDKVWGRERWIVNNEKYCCKILDISCGGCSSLHYHPVKDETFHILEGECSLQTAFMDQHGEIIKIIESRLGRGDTVRIKPRTVHRFYCSVNDVSGCKVLEVSTPHDDLDVVRLEESKRLT